MVAELSELMPIFMIFVGSRTEKTDRNQKWRRRKTILVNLNLSGRLNFHGLARVTKRNVMHFAMLVSSISVFHMLERMIKKKNTH